MDFEEWWETMNVDEWYGINLDIKTLKDLAHSAWKAARSKRKRFKLYWRGDSKEEVIEGETIEDAFTHAGYGRGAIGALDCYEEIRDAKEGDDG